MTAVVFIAGLIGAWLWYSAIGVWLVDGLTIYVALFVATLATGCAWAFANGPTNARLAALVLIFNFGGSHYAWQTDNPILLQTALDVATAGWFIIIGKSRWEMTIGGIYLLSVIAGALTVLDIIPDNQERARLFIAWSYPDIAAVLGHFANIALGMGSGDAGKLVRLFVANRPALSSVRDRWYSRLGVVEKAKKDEPRKK